MTDHSDAATPRRRFIPVPELDPIRQHALSYAVSALVSGHLGQGVIEAANDYIAFLSPEDVLEQGQMPMVLDGHRDLESLIQVVECAISTGRLNHHAQQLANRLSEELVEHLAECGAHTTIEN